MSPCHVSAWASSFKTRVSYRYIVSFLLDSSVGLLVIYACIRLTVKLADKWKWRYLYFGEYGWYFKSHPSYMSLWDKSTHFLKQGNPPSAKAWAAQSGVYMGIMVVEKILITFLVQLEFWDKVFSFINLSIHLWKKLEHTLCLFEIGSRSDSLSHNRPKGCHYCSSAGDTFLRQRNSSTNYATRYASELLRASFSIAGSYVLGDG